MTGRERSQKRSETNKKGKCKIKRSHKFIYLFERSHKSSLFIFKCEIQRFLSGRHESPEKDFFRHFLPVLLVKLVEGISYAVCKYGLLVFEEMNMIPSIYHLVVHESRTVIPQLVGVNVSQHLAESLAPLVVPAVVTMK